MATRPAIHPAWRMLGLAVLAVFASLGLARFGYTMILPEMQRHLGLTHEQTGVMQSWNLLGYLIAVVAAGALSAHLGPRRVVAVALLTIGLAMAGTGLARGYVPVCAGRFFAGLGGAAANVPAMGLVAAWFARRRRGVAAGIAVAGSSLGLMVAGPLVPALGRRFGPDGWRASWLVFGGLALAIGVLWAAAVRNRPSDLGQTPLGDDGEAAAGASPRTAGRWRELCLSGRLWHLSAVYFAFGFAYIIYSTFFVKHLEQAAAMSPAAAGRVWMLVGLASVASGLLWGWVSDRRGRRPALTAIFIVQGLSFVLFGASAHRAALLLSAGLFALTAWSIPALMAALAADRFGDRLAPAALGLMTAVFGVGQVLGPWAAGGLADRFDSFAPAFVLAGVAALAGAAGACGLPRG